MENTDNRPSDEFNLMRNTIVRAIIRYRWLILIIFTISVITSLSSSSKLVDIYSATATLRFQDETGQATRSLGILNQMGSWSSYRWNMDPILDQMSIIRSRSVAEGVVRKLNANYTFRGLSFTKPGNTTIEVIWLSENPKCDSYRIVISEDGSFHVFSEGNTEAGNGFIGDTVNLDFAWIFIHQKEPDTGSGYIKIIPIEIIAEYYRRRLAVSNIEQTNMLAVTIRDPNPEKAREIVNAFARVIIEYDIQRSRSVARSVREFIEQQLLITTTSLEEAEKDLRSIQEKYGWLSAYSEEVRVQQQIGNLATSRVDAMVKVRTLEERKRVLKEQLEGYGAFNIYSEAQFKPELSSNPSLNAIQTEVNQYEIERAELLGKYTENHPRIKEIDSILIFLRDELVLQVQQQMSEYGTGPVDEIWSSLASSYIMTEVELSSTRALLRAIETAIENVNSELDSLPEEMAMYERVYRMVEVEKRTYSTLLEKLQGAKISEATQVGNISLVDTALTPSRPIGPNRKKNIIIGAFVGLLLGIGLSYILEKIDTTIRDVEEIEEHLGLTVLGIIPIISYDKFSAKRRVKEKDRKSSDEEIAENIKSHLITHFAPKSPVAEAYRTIRTGIQFSSVKEPIKTLLIASALPKEGKSTTAANLAVAFAQQGLKTLLIDTDMRKPVIHHVFNIARTPGIVECLMKEKKIEQIVNKTDVENLFIISCGAIPPNPSEVIASTMMDDFILAVKKKYDFIIFDSPPLLAVTDATLLSTKTDGTLLIIRAQKTDRDAAQASLKLLKNVNATVKGSILNNVDISSRYGYHYYYRYYYQYYYGHGREGFRKKRKYKKNIFKYLNDFFK